MALLGSRTSRRERARRASHEERPQAQPDPARCRPPVIELHDTTVVYPGGHVALERINLTVNRGEFAFVVGPTGCGKSTLIKTLIREVEPAAGHVLIAGRDINRIPRKKVPLLRRRIGCVCQVFKLLPNRTVYDNVASGLQLTARPRPERRR